LVGREKWPKREKVKAMSRRAVEKREKCIQNHAAEATVQKIGIIEPVLLNKVRGRRERSLERRDFSQRERWKPPSPRL